MSSTLPSPSPSLPRGLSLSSASLPRSISRLTIDLGTAPNVRARMINPHPKARSSASSFASSLDHLHRPHSRTAPNVRSRTKSRHVLVTYSRRFPLVSFVSFSLVSVLVFVLAGWPHLRTSFRDLLVVRHRPMRSSARDGTQARARATLQSVDRGLHWRRLFDSLASFLSFDSPLPFFCKKAPAQNSFLRSPCRPPPSAPVHKSGGPQARARAVLRI
ncbi:hypothetical protein DAEQUDRAFT_349492 [Daedalea quercina L-15889]|uniref:Transmembrane protein n=1 Tax=Daedalea quercina L-15889 TaxID=1314783 RepID=A0A165PDW0_9APHY|nr:hypothetical protein DAEQUDRAFT_349492 [Daedalea quercina L-15889]